MLNVYDTVCVALHPLVYQKHLSYDTARYCMILLSVRESPYVTQFKSVRIICLTGAAVM